MSQRDEPREGAALVATIQRAAASAISAFLDDLDMDDAADAQVADDVESMLMQAIADAIG